MRRVYDERQTGKLEDMVRTGYSAQWIWQKEEKTRERNETKEEDDEMKTERMVSLVKVHRQALCLRHISDITQIRDVETLIVTTSDPCLKLWWNCGLPLELMRPALKSERHAPQSR